MFPFMAPLTFYCILLDILITSHTFSAGVCLAFLLPFFDGLLSSGFLRLIKGVAISLIISKLLIPNNAHRQVKLAHKKHKQQRTKEN